MHDKSGPLHPTPSMLELLRLCRALGEAPGAKGKPARKLDLAAVHAIETELGATLPDDVLVVLASGARILTTATGLALDAILDCAEDWSEGIPDDHVAIAAVYEDPFAEREEGAHGGAFEVIAVPRSGERSSPDVMIGYDGNWETKTTLAAFAREKIAAWYSRETSSWMTALKLEPTLPLEDPAFRPALTGTLRAPPVQAERWVVHPKFGRGRVVEARPENGETKLVIDFEAAGRKTLLERFVSPA